MKKNKIKQEIKNKKFTIEEAAEKIGMTRTGLGQALSNESLKVRDLEKLCELLGVSPAAFFDSGKIGVQVVQNGARDNHVSIGECQEKVKGLEALLAEKDKRISLLERLLDKQ